MKKRFIAAIAAASALSALSALYALGTNIEKTCVPGNSDFEAGTGVCNVKNRAATPEAQAQLAKDKAEKAAKAEADRAIARKAADVALAKQAAELEARGEWLYSSYEDGATGKQAKTGSLTSKNSMNFDFPYGGIQYGRFTVRNHPRYGVDAYLTIDKGQLLCNRYNNTNVLVRFDNGAANSYSCAEPADHSSETVFIEGVGRLEERMKTAKKMYVTVSVYGEGSRTWEFNVKGYNRTKI